MFGGQGVDVEEPHYHVFHVLDAPQSWWSPEGSNHCLSQYTPSFCNKPVMNKQVLAALTMACIRQASLYNNFDKVAQWQHQNMWLQYLFLSNMNCEFVRPCQREQPSNKFLFCCFCMLFLSNISYFDIVTWPPLSREIPTSTILVLKRPLNIDVSTD